MWALVLIRIELSRDDAFLELRDLLGEGYWRGAFPLLFLPERMIRFRPGLPEPVHALQQIHAGTPANES
jgi:hypothetical protein